MNPGGFGAAGVSLDSPRAQTGTFQGSRPSNTPPKFNEKTARETKRTKWEREREKKKRNFGGGVEGCPAGGQRLFVAECFTKHDSMSSRVCPIPW